MTSKIELKTLKFYAYHGVAPQETKVGNWFIIDVTLTAPLEAAIRSDALEETINYAEVYEIVKKEMQIPSRLLEHVAGRILDALKVRFPQLRETELKIAKLNPPFGGDVYSAAILLNEKYNS